MRERWALLETALRRGARVPLAAPHGHRLLAPRPVTFQALQPDRSAASSLQTQVQRFQRLPRPRRLLPTRPCARDVGVPRFLPALTPRRWPVLFPTSSPHLCVDLSAPPPAHQASVSPPVRWGHEAVRTGDARGKNVRRARRTTSRPWAAVTRPSPSPRWEGVPVCVSQALCLEGSSPVRAGLGSVRACGLGT